MNSHSQQGEVRKKEWQWKNESHGCRLTVRFGASDGKSVETSILLSLLEVWEKSLAKDARAHE